MVYETVYRGISEKAAGFIYIGFKESFGAYLIRNLIGKAGGIIFSIDFLPKGE